MSNTTLGSIIAGTQSVDVNTHADQARDMKPETVARLRDICERRSEAFDGNLTELHGKKRIAALMELHDLA